MSRLILVLLVPLLLLGGPLLLVIAAIGPQPLVTAGDNIAYDDVSRIKTLLQSHDPRQLQDGETRRLELSERDLNLLLASALPYPERQRWQVQLAADRADIKLTLLLPATPLGSYLNISAPVQAQEARLQVGQVNFGKLAVPGWLVNPLLGAAHTYLQDRSTDYRDLLAAVRTVQITPTALTVVYQWHAELAGSIASRGRDLLLPADDRQRVSSYYGAIGRLSHALDGSQVSLNELLQPLFTLAARRTDEGGGLADAIGVFKEVDDSRGGSGFSFADLLADRAGVSLAMAALGDQARALQAYMSSQENETGYMPGFTHLPEGLMELEFKFRYEDLDSAGYTLVNNEIERRISACELYRQLRLTP